MNRLELIPVAGDDSQQPTTERYLTIGTGNVPNGCAVAASVLERGLLTSVHLWQSKQELFETAVAKPRLTRDNPFLTEREQMNLDEDGLVRFGTVVAANEVIASIVELDLQPSARGLVAPTHGNQWVSDRTWNIPAGWEGAVVTAIRRFLKRDFQGPVQKNFLEELEVELRADRPLQIGDVLLIGDRPVVVSAIMSDPPRDRSGNIADVVVSPEFGCELGITRDHFDPLPVAKAIERAEDQLTVRNVGPYSLIGQEPLKGKHRFGGQSISVSHIEWLIDHGLRALAGELACLKSDDLSNRKKCDSLLTGVAGKLIDLDKPNGSESLAEIIVYLTGLGFCVCPCAGDGCVTLQIEPSSPEQLLAQSGGRVSKSETIHYRTYEDVDDGLFGPNIFGFSSGSRRRRFGHIQLAVPIVPMLIRIGHPSPLDVATGLSQEAIDRVITYEANIHWQENGPFLVGRADDPSPRSESNLGTGAVALRTLLALRMLNEPSEAIRICQTFITEIVPVVPPDWRPLVLLDNGNFATSDLNDLYRAVINRNNRLIKLIDLAAPQVILDNEARLLQHTVDLLHANCVHPKAKADIGSDGRRMVDLLSLLLQKIQQQEKRVDWSGAARLVADAAVNDRSVQVPQRIFETLKLGCELPLLITSQRARGRFVARMPYPHATPALVVSPATYELLANSEVAPLIAYVHRPITNTGCSEAIRLVRDEPLSKAAVVPSDMNWFDSATAGELAAKLVDAARFETRVELNSARGVLLGGTGSTLIGPDTPNEALGDRYRQVRDPDN